MAYTLEDKGQELEMSIMYPYLQDVLQKGSQDLFERSWAGLPLKIQVDLSPGGELCLSSKSGTKRGGAQAKEHCGATT